MERIRHFLHSHQKDLGASTDRISQENLDNSALKKSQLLLDQLEIEKKLLKACEDKFGHQSYITRRTISTNTNTEDPDPWVICRIETKNEPEFILEIGVLLENYHGMSNQIYISEKAKNRGEDYFKQATVLLEPNCQEVFERQANGQHQTTNEWINEKLESFINPKK